MPQSRPLQENELRQILSQLIELEALRKSVSAYEVYIREDAERDLKERALQEQQLKLKDWEIALMTRERDLEKKRADDFEKLYNVVTKKRSIGCLVKKIVTFGIATCK